MIIYNFSKKNLEGFIWKILFYIVILPGDFSWSIEKNLEGSLNNVIKSVGISAAEKYVFVVDTTKNLENFSVVESVEKTCVRTKFFPKRK